MNANQAPLDNRYLAELLRGNDEVLDRAAGLQKILTREQLDWRPEDGGWSAGQVFEHLVISGALYVDRIDAVIDRARSSGLVRQRPWKASMMGGAIMRAILPTNTRKRATQKVFTPGPTARPDVIAEFIKLHERLERQLRNADGLDLRAVKISSPVSSLIRMNLGDAFGILVFHAQRHLLQAGRVLSEREETQGRNG